MWQKYWCLLISVSFLQNETSNTSFDNEVNLKCFGKRHENVTLTAYFPNYDVEEHDGGYKDLNGIELQNLQDYLDDRTEYVTLSMDEDLQIPYGSLACIPEINDHFGHRIRFEIRDSSTDISGTGFKRAEICVRSEIDSYDISYNRRVTLVII